MEIRFCGKCHGSTLDGKKFGINRRIKNYFGFDDYCLQCEIPLLKEMKDCEQITKNKKQTFKAARALNVKIRR